MDGDGVVVEDVGVGDAGVVEGKVGGVGAGDEDGAVAEEGREAVAGAEATELGEGESAGDDVVLDDGGVEVGSGVDAGEDFVGGDEEGGGDGEGGGVEAEEDVGPAAEVAGADQGLDDVPYLRRRHLLLRRSPPPRRTSSAAVNVGGGVGGEEEEDEEGEELRHWRFGILAAAAPGFLILARKKTNLKVVVRCWTIMHIMRGNYGI